MIGVGRDADPATGTERGLQFSLFDVSDELNPRQAAVRILADRGSDSEALDDAKAFQYWSASDLRAAGVASPGIFAVPAQLASLFASSAKIEFRGVSRVPDALLDLHTGR